jgi:hypothetical protein
VGFLPRTCSGEVVGVDAEEPADVGAVVLEVAGGLVGGAEVEFAVDEVAEDVVEHVEEVDADVGGEAEAAAGVALPALVVPAAAAGDVGELDVVGGGAGVGVDLGLEGADGVVVAELEDVVDALAGLVFEGAEGVEVGDGGHEGLLADDVGAEAEAGGDVGAVEVVGAADADVVECGVGVAPLVPGVLVEAFEVGEEVAVGADAVDDADAVVGVVGADEGVAGVGDGAHVAGGDVAGGADEGEALHAFTSFPWGCGSGRRR